MKGQFTRTGSNDFALSRFSPSVQFGGADRGPELGSKEVIEGRKTAEGDLSRAPPISASRVKRVVGGRGFEPLTSGM